MGVDVGLHEWDLFVCSAGGFALALVHWPTTAGNYALEVFVNPCCKRTMHLEVLSLGCWGPRSSLPAGPRFCAPVRQ